jgi:hypothetical protein
VPSFQDQLTERAVESYLKQNPGKTMADAFEWLRGAGRPDRAALTYAQASDDVQKLLDSTNGMMEVYEIKQSAKKAGKPEPSLAEIKEMLIQRMLQDSRSRFAGQGSPTSAKTMTMADVQATAKSSGKTVDEVKRAAAAAGYTIQ